VKKEERNYIYYLEDILLSMQRVQEYFGIDCEIIWDIASNQLPTNQLEIEKIIEKEKNTGASRVDGHEP